MEKKQDIMRIPLLFMFASLIVALANLVQISNGKSILIEPDIVKKSYVSIEPSYKWISEDEITYFGQVTNLANLNYSRSSKAEACESVNASICLISPDGYFALAGYNVQTVYRHSTKAQYKVFNLANNDAFDLHGAEFIQLAVWGPVGYNILYIYNNDIYYVDSANNEFRITFDGIPDTIFNGVADWVCEEEVFGTSQAFWFSEDGKYLVFLQFNDTEIPIASYTTYGEPSSLLDQYSKQINIRYPKAGKTNPRISMYLVSFINGPELSEIALRLESDLIPFGVTWNKPTSIVTLLKNRVQNRATLIQCDVLAQECISIFNNSNPNGWDLTGNPIFDKNGERYLSIESVGDTTTYRHLVLRQVQPPFTSIQLTSGSRNVLSVNSWDEANGVVYYSGTEEEDPISTQMFKVSDQGGPSTCVTCSMLTPEGNHCKLVKNATFSPSCNRVILHCSGPDPPFTAVYDMRDTLRKPLHYLQNNDGHRKKSHNKLINNPIITTVDINNEFKAYVRLNLPENFSENKKYPLLIEVYAGPDTSQVSYEHKASKNFYGKHIAETERDIIYGYIDGRGSNRQSDQMLFAGYRNLGTVEIYDQINVTRALQDRYSWIDRNRTAIWGWSYGGYATARVLESDSENVFKCGISVAPVTSWIYYDSIYTERYMGLPIENDNLVGYENADTLNKVENLRNKEYYLIHGAADDNVHYQNSMQLSRALELNDILFQQQTYPEEAHSLSGVLTHLYHSMDVFWDKCFNFNQ